MRPRITLVSAGLVRRAGGRGDGGTTVRAVKMARACAVLTGILAAVLVPAGAVSASTGGSYWCVQSHSPWHAYEQRRPPLPHPCARGYVITRIPTGTTQLVTVGAASYGTSWATISTFTWTGGRWVHRQGPWTARIGERGMAPPGRKTEGDLRTPQGSYGFAFMFGVLANPGVLFGWRHAYRYDYWDDDPASPLYNEWVDTRHQNPGARPERMHQIPVYDYAAVIAYNTTRVPGAGRAIFLHVGNGSATAGCVSLPVTRLLAVLRWLNPARHPVIAMQVIP